MITYKERKTIGNFEYFTLCSKLIIIPKNRRFIYILFLVFLALNTLCLWTIANIKKIQIECIISLSFLWIWLITYILIFCGDPGLPKELLTRIKKSCHKSSNTEVKYSNVESINSQDGNSLIIGEVQLNENKKNEEGVEGNEFLEFCRYCGIYKRKGVRHCRVCKVCINGFDHHCVFLLKCVGKGNKIGFYVLVGVSLALFASQAKISFKLLE